MTAWGAPSPTTSLSNTTIGVIVKECREIDDAPSGRGKYGRRAVDRVMTVENVIAICLVCVAGPGWDCRLGR